MCHTSIDGVRKGFSFQNYGSCSCHGTENIAFTSNLEFLCACVFAHVRNKIRFVFFPVCLERENKRSVVYRICNIWGNEKSGD